MSYNKENVIHGLFHITHLMKRKRHMDEAGKIPDYHPPRERDRLLGILKDHPEGVSQRALAEELHIRPQSVAELLDKLEADALIERKSNPNDRRARLVFVTEEGVTRFEALHEQLKKNNEAVLSCLTEEEGEQLESLLAKILAHAEETLFTETENQAP